jgi:D-lactate dehydrogenase (cytochrome)
MHEPVCTSERPGSVGAAIAEFFASFGNRVVTSRAVCEQHAHTTTWLPTEPPDAVFYPQNTEDVQQAVRICARHRVPIVAFGSKERSMRHSVAFPATSRT